MYARYKEFNLLLLSCFSKISCLVSNVKSLTTSEVFNNVSTYSVLSSVISLSWSFTSYEATKLKGALDFSVNALGRILIWLSNVLQVRMLFR